MTPAELLGKYTAYTEFLNTCTDPSYGDAQLIRTYGNMEVIRIKPNLPGFMKWLATTITPPPAP